MPTAAELAILITSRDQASAVLQQVGVRLDEVERKGASAGQSGSRLGELFTGGALVAVGAIGGLVAGLGAAVKAAADAELVTAQLDAVLTSTGGAAGVTKGQVLELAESLSQVTMFEDDAIVSGQNLLLTFTKIGADVFPDATKAMLNMSQALGQDLKASAIQLGKALQDPIAGITALRRVGVSFSEEQLKVIKRLQETGDLVGAQRIILAELETQFGGAAEAAGQTLAGQLTILKNSLGNVVEEIGGALLPILTPLVTALASALPGALNAVKGAIDLVVSGVRALVTGEGFDLLYQRMNELLGVDLAGFLAGIIDPIATLIHGGSQLGSMIGSLHERGGEAFAGLQRTASGALELIMFNLGRFEELAGRTFAAVQGFLDAFVAFWEPRVGAAIGAVQEFMRSLDPNLTIAVTNVFTWIKTVVTNLVQFWEQNWGTIRTVLEGVWKVIEGIVRVAWSVVSGIIKAGLALLAGDWEGAWEAIKGAMSGAWDGIKLVLEGGLQAIVALIVGFGPKILDALTQPFRTAEGDIERIIRNIASKLPIIGGAAQAVNAAQDAARQAAEGAAGGTTQGAVGGTLQAAGGFSELEPWPGAAAWARRMAGLWEDVSRTWLEKFQLSTQMENELKLQDMAGRRAAAQRQLLVNAGWDPDRSIEGQLQEEQMKARAAAERLVARRQRAALRERERARRDAEGRLALHVAAQLGIPLPYAGGIANAADVLGGREGAPGTEGLAARMFLELRDIMAELREQLGRGVMINGRELAGYEASGPRTSRLLTMTGAAYGIP